MTEPQPSPKHRFTFGLHTNAHPRPGPISDSSLSPIEPWDFVYGIAETGAWGVAVRDDELVPPTTTRQEYESILGKFRAAIDDTGLAVSAVSTDLSAHPVFADGAFTSAAADVRRYALQKALRTLDLAAELGAPIHVLDTADERPAGTAVRAATDTLDRYREAIDFLCGYVYDQGYPVTLALGPGASASRGEALIPTIGHALAFIETLDHPDMAGLSPRATPQPMAGQPTYCAVAQAVWSGRLAHIDLTDARIDLDHGFGAAGLKDAFFLVKLLEESDYTGPRHFSAAGFGEGSTRNMWDFASGCMRTYLALAAKARRFAADPDIQEALADAGALEMAQPTVGSYSRKSAHELTDRKFDPDSLAIDRYHHEHLDQLVTDLVLGIR